MNEAPMNETMPEAVVNTAGAAPMADEHAAGVEDGRGVCLATVTTASFLPGTLVTIGSFLKAHPGFKGDVAVIHDDLPQTARDLLRLSFDRVRFVQVSPELRRRSMRVAEALPWIRGMVSHFYAFEAFRLAGYRKVLFCDGDLLFRQPVGELFGAKDALLCCGDDAFLRNKHRDKVTFMITDDPAGGFTRTFNDGFLLIDAALTGEGRYADLLAMLAPETWPDPDMCHTKQFLQNRCFAGRQTLISSTYNFLLGSAARIRSREGLTATDAKVLHFNLPIKPWMADAMLAWEREPLPVAAFKLWYDAWMDCLAARHLRLHAQRFAAMAR